MEETKASTRSSAALGNRKVRIIAWSTTAEFMNCWIINLRHTPQSVLHTISDGPTRPLKPDAPFHPIPRAGASTSVE